MKLEDLRARQAAAHDIPRAGTLHEISYCRACGAPFNSTELCPRKKEHDVQATATSNLDAQ